MIGWPADPALMIVSDPNGPSAPLTITGVTQGAHGAVTLDAKGNVTYTAVDGFSGSDSYTYTETDGEGMTTTGTVNVTVIPTLSITAAAGAADGPVLQPGADRGGRLRPYLWTVQSGQIPSGLTLVRRPAFVVAHHFARHLHIHRAARTRRRRVRKRRRGRSRSWLAPIVTTTFLPNAFVNTPQPAVDRRRRRAQ
jgi:VCBS repeat-containing protein